MDVRVLGPLGLGSPTSPAARGLRKTRQVIVLLTLAAPRSMSAAQLADALWDDPPPSAIKTVQAHVSRARAALSAATGTTMIGGGVRGYVLEIPPDRTDVGRLEALWRAGRDAMARRDASTAAARFAEARALWRGEVELPDTRVGAIDRARLEERRLALVEDQLESLLQLGRTAEVLDELEEVLRTDPWREQLWALRMRALYRAGRQADALRAYQDVRLLMVEELGIEPGPELRHLEVSILDHAPELRGSAIDAGASLEVDLPRYVEVDGRLIAYAIFGTGGQSVLCLVPGFITIDAYLEEPRLGAALARLAEGRQIVALDRSGLGLSDPAAPDDPPTLERWVEDVVAVLDDAGMDRVAVLANGDTCLVAVALAAAHPHRVRTLTLLDPYARLTPTEDYPFGFGLDELDDIRRPVRSPGSAGPDHLALVAPSRSGDDRFRAWWDRVGRRAASPTTAHLLLGMIASADVRADLPHVVAPTHVIVRRSCPSYDPDHGRAVATRIPNATITESDDTDDLWWLGDLDQVIASIPP